jgi:hypothetical protein
MASLRSWIVTGVATPFYVVLSVMTGVMLVRCRGRVVPETKRLFLQIGLLTHLVLIPPAFDADGSRGWFSWNLVMLVLQFAASVFMLLFSLWVWSTCPPTALPPALCLCKRASDFVCVLFAETTHALFAQLKVATPRSSKMVLITTLTNVRAISHGSPLHSTHLSPRLPPF